MAQSLIPGAQPAPVDLAGRLIAETQQTLALVTGLPEAQISQVPEGHTWSIRDYLAHLASADKNLLRLIERGLAGDATPLPGFDLDRFNLEDVAATRDLSLAEVLDAWQRARSALLERYSLWTPEQLSTVCWHPFFGQQTVAQFIRIMAVHQRAHRRDIQKLIDTVS
ncbi:MAG: DinB family protein [Chloroflexi bacterium]|nr:DinB family protein [Chloroflexota bacterium]